MRRGARAISLPIGFLMAALGQVGDAIINPPPPPDTTGPACQILRGASELRYFGYFGSSFESTPVSSAFEPLKDTVNVHWVGPIHEIWQQADVNFIVAELNKIQAVNQKAILANIPMDPTTWERVVVPILKPYYDSGTILGFLIVDDQWGIPRDEADRRIRMIKTDFPQVVTVAIFTSPNQATYIPPEIDWIGLQMYMWANTANAPPLGGTPYWKAWFDSLLPAMQPHQKFILVPGAFYDIDCTGRTRCAWEDRVHLESVLNVVPNNPRIVGIFPFVWGTDLSQNFVGTAEIPVYRTLLRGLGGCFTRQVAPQGTLDAATCDSFAGWAFDADTPNSPETVCFFDGPRSLNKSLGCVSTTGVRPDINSYYGVTGPHGFGMDTPDSVKDGASHAIHAYALNTGSGPDTLLTSSPINLSCGPVAPKLPMGTLETATCSRITGWAFDPDTPSSIDQVCLYDGPVESNRLIQCVDTTVTRSDINATYGITGTHGFDLPTPEVLKNGAPHSIHAYGINTGPGANTLLSNAPINLTCGLPTPQNPTGTLESATCDHITGWAYDPDTPSTPGQVCLYDGPVESNRLIQCLNTAVTRTDINATYGITGTHGFELLTPEVLKNGAAHAVYAYGINTGPGANTLLGNSPINVSCAVSVQPPMGTLDMANCSDIAGWAFDPDTPNSEIAVHIWDGPAGTGRILGGVTASTSRPDVNAAYGVGGNHGFGFPTPESIKDGAPHSIYVYAINSGPGDNPPLAHAPMIVTCTPQPPRGVLDRADCNDIAGWAFDPDSPNAEIAVHIWDGPAGSGRILGGVSASLPRPDVNAAYGINGNHGFGITTPESIKDGAPHSIYIYGINTGAGGNPALTGAPRIVNCLDARSLTGSNPVTAAIGGSAVKVYPNPWRADQPADAITFEPLTAGSIVKIFTLSGHWVKTLHVSGTRATWNVANDTGDRVASGLYLYLISDPQGGKNRGKLAVIR